MTTDNDFVVEKLAIQDWKRGHKDHHSGFGTAHDIQAPDLLANPWLLVEALWKRGYDVELCHHGVDIWQRDDEPYEEFTHSQLLASATVIDGNLPAGLLQAAADILRKEE